MLNQVFSRAVWIDDYTASDKPGGVKGDDLPDYRDELVVIPTPEGEVPIWLQHVPRGDGELIWKISNRSVARIPELYSYYSYPKLVEKIRNWTPDGISFLGLEGFKWVILVAVLVVFWPVFYLLGWLIARIISSPESPNYRFVKRLFRGPLTLIALLMLIGTVIQNLGTGIVAQEVMHAHTLRTIAFAWLLIALIDLYKNVKQQSLMRQERPGAAKLLRPLSTLIKIVIILFALLFWLNNIGVNITTVLAGLGVGGLAVALALQKPLEDMMGALTIFSQAPIRVGDLCRYGQTVGRVEDIGLRTTRIRTLTNTVVSVPNSQVAIRDLENLTYRTKIRYWPTLRLRYDTGPEQIERICAGIVALLEQTEFVHDDGIRARFTDFAEDAILIKVHCFLKTTEFPQSLEYREELNLGIMKIVAAEGARFALPGRAIQVEGEISQPPT
jgi:MscS family membrane protein